MSWQLCHGHGTNSALALLHVMPRECICQDVAVLDSSTLFVVNEENICTSLQSCRNMRRKIH